MKTLKGNSFANKLPDLPTLEMKNDWPKFWMIMEHWLTKPKSSVGNSGRLSHIHSDDEFNDVEASMVVDDALVSVLNGNALKTSCFKGSVP